MQTPQAEPHHPRFTRLLDFLTRIPAVRTNESPGRGISSGLEGGVWWVKFAIDIDHPLAWCTVQELAYVLNELSLGERLPSVFRPVSPPPYLNGGPRDYLFWVIECPDAAMRPGAAADWLEQRLPRPVDDEAAWPDPDA